MISLGLGNYYGEVIALERDGKYFLQLEDWSGPSEVEISEKLYKMIKKEFSK